MSTHKSVPPMFSTIKDDYFLAALFAYQLHNIAIIALPYLKLLTVARTMNYSSCIKFTIFFAG